MRIAFDASSLGRAQTGVGWYTTHLLVEISRLCPGNEIFLSDYLLGPFATLERAQSPLGKLPLIRALQAPFPFMTLCRLSLWLGRRGGGKKTLKGCDIFFGTNFRGVFADGMRTVLTIHDMVHEYYPETVQEANMRYYHSTFPEDVKRADLLIAVSEATRQDIMKFLKVPAEKIKVIYNGVDRQFRPVTEPEIRAEVRKKYGLPEHFILMVGSIQPRKNIHGALDALASLQKSGHEFPLKLVLAGGGGWKNEGLAEQISTYGLVNQVIMTGYVPEDALPVLYSLADMLLFPSLYEGFGLPVVEAMACGTPVVTSNTSCLPEIAGDAAVLVDPHDSASIAEGIRSLLEDQVLRQQCIERGLARARMFTWEDAALKTLQAFYELTGSTFSVPTDPATRYV